MNLPELITKLLQIEKDLIEQGIEINDVKVVDSYFDNINNTYVNTYYDSLTVVLLDSRKNITLIK